MFEFNLLKYTCIAGISFNIWKSFALVAFRFPQFQIMFWFLFIAALILHTGLWSEQAQMAIANQLNSTQSKVAIANTCSLFACLLAGVTTVVEAVQGVI